MEQLPTKLQKCRVNQNIISGVQICELPDEILTAILSRLTMKEAACTTVLSHRWKDLWTHTTGSLDFDGSNILWTHKLKVESYLRHPEPVRERPAFIRWVYQILKSHKGATIDEFRVHFDLDSSSTSYINSWINFALKKRAQRLELDLERVAVHWERMYLFPTESVIGHPTINSLTSLKLSYVGVTQELLEYVLSNCPFLKYLYVCSSQILVGAQVVAAPPKLEYLEISYCHRVKFLEISSAINLRTLKYAGPIARLCFKNAPNLTDVSFGSLYAGDIVKKFHEHSIPPSQIEKLKLDLSFNPLERLDVFPNFENLKQLELVVTGGVQSSILCYTTLLEKCPMLYRLCVKFKWLRFPNKMAMQEKECRLNSLKFVEIDGFSGVVSDVELATFVLTNAPYLEKITLDTRFPLHFTGTILEVLQKENVFAKQRARQLLTKLSPSVEFLIL